MKTGGVGGANTKTGLKFERRANILTVIGKREGYTVKNNVISYKGEDVASSYKKYSLYKSFLEPRGVNYKEVLSKKLLPDEAIYVNSCNTLFVIEMKFQKVGGSVDEKLQTCDFKKKQYTKLLKDIKVEYIYILNDWFKKDEYRDVLEYVRSVGCHYYFNELPLSELSLPV